MKHVSANVDQIQVLLNKNRMKINADVNAKNSLTKEHVVKNLFGIQVIANV